MNFFVSIINNYLPFYYMDTRVTEESMIANMTRNTTVGLEKADLIFDFKAYLSQFKGQSLEFMKAFTKT